jgi:hypothetical protein
VRRKEHVPPTIEPHPSYRELLEEFLHASVRGKLKALGGLVLLLPFLVLAFLFGFFFFGGAWVLFRDDLPDWLERLFFFLLVVLFAWSVLVRWLDRLERGGEKRPPI